MSNVFLSYARTHQPFVQRLHEALAERNKEGWVDWAGIPPAEEWMPQIEAAIDAANVFAFVITVDSLRSAVCARELDRAVARNKRLIPLLGEDVPISEIPAPLRARQLLRFRPDDDFDTSFEDLVAAIDRDLVHVNEHTRLPLRADRWASLGRDAGLLLRDLELDNAQGWLAAGADKEPSPTALHAEFIAASSAALKQSRAIDAERLARARRSGYALQLSRVAALPETGGDEAQRMLDDPTQTPLDLRDFCWGFLHHRFLGQHWRLCGGSSDPQVVCLSPDGRLAAAGFSDGSISRWSESQGMPTAMSAHNGAVRRLVFSPDGTRLASAGSDGIVQIVAAGGGEPLARIEIGAVDHVAIAFTPRGRLRVVASRGGDLFVGSWPSTRQLAKLAGEQGRIARLEAAARGGRFVVARDGGAIEIHSFGRLGVADRLALASTCGVLALSADGRRLAWAGVDRGIVEVRHGARLLRRQTITVPELLYVRDLRFSPDGRSLAVAGDAQRREPRAWLTLFGGRDYRQARPLHGHLSAPLQINFSADGRWVASCGMDGLILVNELAARVDASASAPDVRAPRAVAWSPGGRWLACAGADGGVDLQDLTTGQRRRWDDPGWAPVHLAFSPDETTLAGASVGTYGIGARVQLWTIATGAVRRLHDESAYSVAWSPDGRQLAIGAHGAVIVWDALTGEQRSLFQIRGAVRALAFSPDGACLASGHYTNEIRLTDPVSGEPRGVLKGHSATIIGLGFLDSGRQLVSLSEKDAVLDGPNKYLQRQSPEMIFWDLESARERARIDIEDEVSVATTLALSADGSLVATGHRDGALCLWDPVIAVPRLVVAAHRAPVAALTFSPDGRTLASSAARDDDGLALWQADDWRSSALLKGHKGQVHAVAFTPDSQRLVSGSGYDGGEVMHPGEVLLWDPRTAQCRRLFSEHDNAVRCLAISPDGRTIAALADRALVAIDIASGAPRWRRDLRGSRAPRGSTLAYSADGSALYADSERVESATGSAAPGAAPGNAAWPAGLPPSGAAAQACSSDGTWSAAGTEDGCVHVWSGTGGIMSTGRQRHSGPVKALAFSADGRWLASAGGESSSGHCRPGEAILWRLADMTAVRTLWDHTDAVLAVAFSPDGQYLATGGRSQRGVTRPGDVRLWHLPSLLAGLAPAAAADSNGASATAGNPPAS